ncbi:MAG: hypothetical protein HY516_04805 [Candidatus Aenigmarchaeota archaeon]|nr:hypothetical protein [Candidatus Aenigmarchaeota archaeon]
MGGNTYTGLRNIPDSILGEVLGFADEHAISENPFRWKSYGDADKKVPYGQDPFIHIKYESPGNWDYPIEWYKFVESVN